VIWGQGDPLDQWVQQVLLDPLALTAVFPAPPAPPVLQGMWDPPALQGLLILAELSSPPSVISSPCKATDHLLGWGSMDNLGGLALEDSTEDA